jgi:uncharacterized repeat protein (TIGR01451 family)
LRGGPSDKDAGGGIYVLNASATISNNVISDNDGGVYGGGIFLENSASRLLNNAIRKNVANYGAGLFINNSPATLENNEVDSNSATYDGGGIFLNSSPATIIGGKVSANITLAAGGGVFLNNSQAVLSGTMVLGNQAENGGGMYLDNSASTIKYGYVATNTAGASGGGVYLARSAAAISRTTVTSNTANDGGGAYLLTSPGEFNGNTFTKNLAKISGGALYLEQSAALLVNNVVVDNQAANFGSGIYVWSSSTQIHHTTMARNRGNANIGLYVTGDQGIPSAVDMKNNIIIMHQVGINVTAGHSASLDGTVWGNDALWGSDQISNLVDVAGGGVVATGTVNIRDWPGFVDFDAGDYHLLSTGAAVNTGVNSGIATDIDGHPRPTDSGYDIGADEYYRLELTVIKRTSPNPVQPGSSMTYTIQVENIGNIDLQATITDVLPPKIESGYVVGEGPVTPGQVLTWTSFITRSGGVWTKDIVVTTPITENTVLTNVVRVASIEGATGIYTSIIVLGEIRCEPTIQSTGSGDWNDPTTWTWNLDRVPNSSDVVQILAGHTITATDEMIQILGLCNDGVLQGAPDVRLDAPAYVLNAGQILGATGQAGNGSTCGRPGGLVDLRSDRIQNKEGAVIQGGDGGDGDQCGGDGGQLAALGGDITNNGVMKGGEGGAVVGTGPGDGGGDGGDALVVGSPGTVINTGEMAGGDGGAGNGDASDPQPGGDGGDLKIAADPEAYLGGQQQGGAGGDGAGGGADGGDGDETLAATKSGQIPYDVSLAAPKEVTGPPGVTTAVPVSLINTGALADTYDLAAINVIGWPMSVLTTPLSLEGTNFSSLALDITSPITAVTGFQTQIIITATSRADSSKVAVAVVQFVVGLPECKPNIVSMGNGDWDSPSTWDLNRVPTSNDDVQIEADHTVTGLSSVDIQSLCNGGILQSEVNQPLSVNATHFIYNYGQVLGRDGQSGFGSTCGGFGSSLELRAPAIYNTGLIQPGEGGDGDQCGGNGGSAALVGQNVANDGTTSGGDGGDPDGDGGDVVGLAEPGKLANNGLIAGGDGDPGGDVILVGDPAVSSNGGQQRGGQPNGDVNIAARAISLSGAGTAAGGEDVIIMGGPDTIMDLCNLDEPAIVATRYITLAIASGGEVRLCGNKGGALQAGDQVGVAADDIFVDTGMLLGGVTGDNVAARDGQTMYDVTLFGPGVATGQPGQILSLRVTVINSGSADDTYTMSRVDEAGWEIGTLPSPVALQSISLKDLMLTVTLPLSPDRVTSDLITVNAASQSDPNTTDSTLINVFVDTGWGGSIYLPLVLK